MEIQRSDFIAVPVTRYVSEKNAFVPDHKYTSEEVYFDIDLNGENFTTAFCSPVDFEDLVIGMLAQMGRIRTYDDITELTVDAEHLRASVTTTEDAQRWAEEAVKNPRYFSARKILKLRPEEIFERPRDVRIHASDILATADELLSRLSKTHDTTNGVHSGVIYDQENKKILVFREDVGRHNVFDKLYGWALKNHVEITDKIIVFSGRCSSEMMLKLGRMGIGAVAAKSVPTTLSLNVARKLGITLCARMAPGSFCVYANPERIVL